MYSIMAEIRTTTVQTDLNGCATCERDVSFNDYIKETLEEIENRHGIYWVM